MMVINHNKSTLSIIYYYTTTEYYTGSYTLLEWDASQARYVTGDADTSLSFFFWVMQKTHSRAAWVVRGLGHPNAGARQASAHDCSEARDCASDLFLRASGSFRLRKKKKRLFPRAHPA